MSWKPRSGPPACDSTDRIKRRKPFEKCRGSNSAQMWSGDDVLTLNTHPWFLTQEAENHHCQCPVQRVAQNTNTNASAQSNKSQNPAPLHRKTLISNISRPTQEFQHIPNAQPPSKPPGPPLKPNHRRAPLITRRHILLQSA